MVDLGRRLGLAVQVADVTGAAWQYKKVKRKTERDDALTLPRLPAIEQINGVPACTRAMHQWRALIVYCARRSAEGTRIKNRIRAWLLREAW